MMLPLVILSLSVHEWAHAYSAYRLGDDTASREGRLTLNPLAHIDPLGTLLLPMLGVPFGWAKPVPFNPVRFRRDISMRVGTMITKAAGPASNVLIAIICTLGFAIAYRIAPASVDIGRGAVFGFVRNMIVLNVALALFNLLPIAPLDGSGVVEGFVPYRLRPQWDTYMRYGPMLLLCFLLFGRGLMSGPILYVYGLFSKLMMFVAGIS